MINLALTPCENCSKNGFLLQPSVKGLILPQSWLGSKATYNQPKMQWRVVVFLAVMMAAFDCGPIAGPSDLSRALGSVLEEETTMGI